MPARIAGSESDGGGDEGGGQDLAFQADVDHTGTLREQAGHGGENQHRRVAHGGDEDGAQVEVFECHGLIPCAI
jgi:hypothetical protein